MDGRDRDPGTESAQTLKLRIDRKGLNRRGGIAGNAMARSATWGADCGDVAIGGQGRTIILFTARRGQSYSRIPARAR